MSTKKLVKGYDDGTYKPNQEISNGEVAAIIANDLSYLKVEVSADAISHEEFKGNWSEEHMNKIINNGVTEGLQKVD